jgi:hypothetical protein
MTQVYITIDTEYSSEFAARGGVSERAANFARSIVCKTPDGAVGVEYQLDVFEAHGLKAVFFVDPMPALLWGVASIEDVVGPIVARGHDVQLHLHTEWLALAGPSNPLGSKTGINIKDFDFEDQCRLIERARALLVASGAPAPIAFRAGNYGANDDTLRALVECNLAYDTSHCPGIEGSLCDISLGTDNRQPLHHAGVIEVPVGCIAGFGGRLRHAQVTALTAGEVLSAIRHARRQDKQSFTLVSHSFELLSRDRQRINHIVKRRFEQLCAGLARLDAVRTTTYADSPPVVRDQPAIASILPHNPLRTGRRLAEQALANALYGAR